ncbi:hypothetical protein [Deinococcus budaensis]|uniref:Apolipoprotein N-acyltransferase n=1 Tax=Deinococcus budaensis TaxID=1665626 RepID=A0A7W8GGM5_9DEIO|nr:hypothetical protein [Deinococcus budaensis]MBB5235138.1 apolipoprotein N-acyltransferase [Deinococcus budaensis]
MSLPSRERRLARSRRAEVVAGVLALVGFPLVILWPTLLPAYLGAFLLLTAALTLWQYRVMDEFRRARFLKAWAAAGVAGLTALTGLIVWALVLLAPRGGPGLSVAVSLPLWGLYLPWLAMLAAFFAVTAYLYRRDTRG